MPPRAWVDYTVFIIDCTKNTDDYLQTLYKIVSRKFCGKTKSNKDVYRVIFFNNSNSKALNYITDWSFYELQSLKQFKTELDSIGTPGDHESIVAALQAAVDCYNTEITGPCTKKIVFMTDLNAPPADTENIKQKVNEIRSELVRQDVWLYVIGPRVHVPVIFNQDDVLNMRENIQPLDKLTAEQEQNFAILRKLFRQVNGVVIDLENGLDLVFSLRPAVKAPYPWYTELNIGTDFRIPVSCFRTTRDYVKPKFYPVNMKQEKKMIDTVKECRDSVTHEIVPDKDVAMGYTYHGKIIILTEKQEERVSPSTEKCLSIVGFVDEAKIKKELYFFGHSMNAIIANKKQMETDIPLTLLLEAMRKEKVVALAKRVYANRFNALLYCLFPCPEHPKCLLMAKLPYRHEFLENYRAGQPPKVEATNDSLKADMYGFLDSMNANTDMFGAGEPINPLPEYMKLNRNRLYLYEYLAAQNLGVDPRDRPVLGPDNLLIDRSEEYVDNLIEYFNSNN
ncbi:Ku80 [Carabus blaptoides fortunei]